MKKTIWFAALASVLVMLPLRVPADPTPNVYHSLESRQPHDAGIIRGKIEAVDYSAGVIRVRGPHGVQTITVVPSTSIYHGREYATLSDLRPGQNVEIAAYEVGGRLIAQSIRLN
jgi:Domain of unknown function (DUF5666)